jgi:hypothetical protein
MPSLGQTAIDQLAKDRNRRPTMTEAQWRARGLKAAPTRIQLRNPDIGCCYHCRMKMGMGAIHLSRIIGGLAASAIVIAGLIFLVGTHFN